MTDQPRTKAARPETMSEARTWDRMKNRYLDYGLCHACASQAAWGHQIGFSLTTREPCDACRPLVDVLPKSQSNGWRSVTRARDPRSFPAPAGRPRDDLMRPTPATPLPVPGNPVGDTTALTRTPAEGDPGGPAIVIRTIEGRTPVPPMTPERHAEQVAKLERAGIRVPPGQVP